MKIVRNIITVLIGLAFLYYVRNLLKLDLADFYNTIKKIDYLIILFSLYLYFFSHFLRTFRLYILANDASISFTKLFSLQIKANAVNLLFPFKLGEAYRIFSFSKILGGSLKSIITLAIERSFDIFTLFFYLSIGVLISDKVTLSDIYYIYIPIMVLVVGMLTIITIGEDLVIMFQKRILLKHNSSRSIKLLSLSTGILEKILYVKKLVSSKIRHITIFSLLVWGFEVSCLVLFYFLFGFEVDILLILGVYIAFSSILPNGPIGLGGLQLSFYYINETFQLSFDFISISYTYGILIFGSAVVLGFIFFTLSGLKKIINERK